jgi:hypothetical protein
MHRKQPTLIPSINQIKIGHMSKIIECSPQTFKHQICTKTDERNANTNKHTKGLWDNRHKNDEYATNID